MPSSAAQCLEWISLIIIRTQRGDSAEPLLGAPEGGDDLASGSACPFCRGLLGRDPRSVSCLSVTGGESLWPQLVLCAACAEWLLALARGTASARRLRQRQTDGGYGAFLHGRLRDLRVEADVVDPGARGVIEKVCRRAGITRGPLSQGPEPATLLVEASAEGRASARTAAAAAAAAVVVLTPPAARADLLAALAAGASDWLTLPVTPQQVVAALTRSLRQYTSRREWDAATAFPIASALPEGPVLVFERGGDLEPFELSWLLRRFARGYDELVLFEGHVHLIPRAAAAHLPAIRERFAQMLGGRCGVVLSVNAPRQRLDAAG